MEPQILRLTGVEVQIELFRGSTNTFDAYFTYADGTPVKLNSPARRAVLKITDKAGGTVKYEQTNSSSQHVDAEHGQSRFSIPPSVADGLTDSRAYTWKHLIYLQDEVTGSSYPFFYGDVRVLLPNAAMRTVTPLGVSVGESVSMADGMA